MPSLPPRHRLVRDAPAVHGRQEEKRLSSRQRGYSSRWDRASRAYRAEHPLCRACEGLGRVTPSQVVDHIKPHRGDMELFWDRGNWQALCKRCHDIKTATEDSGLTLGASAHPDWLPKPACPVTIVTGPPGGGKTFFCKANAGNGDEVIDLDDCFAMVCGVHGHEASRSHLTAALRLRNKLIATLAEKRTGQAFVIVSAPCMTEVEWWSQKLDAAHVRINPGLAACLERIGPSPRRAEAARQWFVKADLNDWRPPARRSLAETQ